MKRVRQRGRAGDGTVFQRPDGKWVASISIGGRAARRQIRRVATTESAASEALRKLRDTNRHLQPNRSRAPLPVSVVLDAWLEDQQRRVRPKTYTTYELVVRLHVKPYVGAIRVDRLRPEDVRSMMAALERRGVSPRVRELAFLRLRSALAAVVGESIAMSPVKPAHRPRVERKTMRAWTRDQARAFLDATADDPLGPLYRLALSTGLRRGEMLALRWEDVDVKKRRLSIQHTLTDDGELANAKTSGSRRTIELPARTHAAIVEQRARLLARGLRASKWVFPGEDGEPYSGRRLHRDFVAAIDAVNVARAKRAKSEPLPVIRFHDLRHTAATLALGAGIHPKIVSEMLGHASITITLDTYSHALESLQKDAAKKLDAVL